MVTNLPRMDGGDNSAVYNGAINRPVPDAMPSNILPNTITPKCLVAAVNNAPCVCVCVCVFKLK